MNPYSGCPTEKEQLSHERAVRKVAMSLLKEGADRVEISILQNPGIAGWVLRHAKLRPNSKDVLFLLDQHFKGTGQ